MKIKGSLVGISILFLVFAIAFSIIFWQMVPMAAKIGLFILGFGSGVTAGQWIVVKKG